MNVPGETEYRNKGVTYCPHCDGPLFKGKRVAVIGGGNSGVEAAIDLAGVVGHVTLIEFDDQLRADEVLQRKLRSLPNVDIIVSALTTEVLGDGGKVIGLTYNDRVNGTAHTVDLDGIFVQIGLLPNTEWLKDAVELSPRGEVVIDDRGQTSVPGVFAAGDCTTVPVQADRHRPGRRRDRGPERLRPPHPHVSPGRAAGRRLSRALLRGAVRCLRGCPRSPDWARIVVSAKDARAQRSRHVHHPGTRFVPRPRNRHRPCDLSSPHHHGRRNAVLAISGAALVLAGFAGVQYLRTQADRTRSDRGQRDDRSRSRMAPLQPLDADDGRPAPAACLSSPPRPSRRSPFRIRPRCPTAAPRRVAAALSVDAPQRSPVGPRRVPRRP